MNFNPFVKNLFTKSVRIVRSPKEEWLSIKTDQQTIFQLFTTFLLPLLLLTSVAAITGSYFQTDAHPITLSKLIVSGLKPFLSLLISIFLSILAVNAMIRTYGGNQDLNLAAKIVIYSYIPGIVATIIVGLFPVLYLSGLFFLYSFYIFFQGTPILLDIPYERRSNFSALSSTTILVSYLIVSSILYAFFGAVQ